MGSFFYRHAPLNKMASSLLLSRNCFRAAAIPGTMEWIAHRVPGMSVFDTFCMSQPATNFGHADALPALPLVLFAGNGLVEAQLQQSVFTLDYPPAVIAAYAVVALRVYAIERGLATTIHHSALPPFTDFPAFFDLVAHGPHVDVVLDLVKSWMSTLSDGDLPQLEDAVKTALFHTFQTVRLTDVVTGIPESDGAFPVIHVPSAMAEKLRGAQFLKYAKGMYRTDPVYGYVLQHNDTVFVLKCFGLGEGEGGPGGGWSWRKLALPMNEMVLETVNPLDDPDFF